MDRPRPVCDLSGALCDFTGIQRTTASLAVRAGREREFWPVAMDPAQRGPARASVGTHCQSIFYQVPLLYLRRNGCARRVPGGEHYIAHTQQPTQRPAGNAFRFLNMLRQRSLFDHSKLLSSGFAS